MARPRKYSKKALREAVDRYFDSITRMVAVTEKQDRGRRDDKGHIVFDEVPVTNRLGEQVEVLEYVVPPTVGGLCEALGIHRSTWAEWCDPNKHPEYSDTTTHARGRMRTWCEEQLLIRKDVKGIIFNLQNNYDYKERHEVDLGPGAAKAVSTAGMTMAEKMEMLKSVAEEFGGGSNGPS